MIDQRFGITEGLVIAGVPVVGYWLAFLYELGYCKYFDIPSAFIQIGVLNVLVTMIGILGVLGLINLYLNPVFMLCRGIPGPIRNPLLLVGFLLAVFAGYSIVWRVSLAQFTLVAIMFILPIIFLEFILPLWTQKKVTGYLNKLEAQNMIELKQETLIERMSSIVGRRIFLAAAFIFVVSLAAYFSGGYEAKKQIDFMVVNDLTESVVLKKDGDTYLVAQFDRKGKTVSNNFSLVSGKYPFHFRYERVGPLLPIGLEK